MRNTRVFYDKDTKVATSGTTCTFYRIGLKLEPDGKKALLSLRKDGEQLKNALERLIDKGIEAVLKENAEDIDALMKELYE